MARRHLHLRRSRLVVAMRYEWCYRITVVQTTQINVGVARRFKAWVIRSDAAIASGATECTLIR